MMMEIVVGLFLYFFFLWAFRFAILLLIALLVGKVKKSAESKLKETLEGLKGGEKDNGNV